MMPRSRRRRTVATVAIALACGGLAASRVHSREAALDAQVGPLVPVVVARADVAPGARLSAAQLAVRRVPQRFAPADGLESPQQVVGQRLAAALAPGSYLTAGDIAASGPHDDGTSAPLAPGERSIEVAVAGGEALTSAPPGSRVDVLVTTDPSNGQGRTFLALQDVELLGARSAGDAGGRDDGAAAHADALATLRVTLREAALLTAAEGFAREVRLLVRAPGDRRSSPPLAVDGNRL